MTYLSDGLVGTLDDDLLWPPVVPGHGVKEPLTGRGTRVVLLGQQLYPL